MLRRRLHQQRLIRVRLPTAACGSRHLVSDAAAVLVLTDNAQGSELAAAAHTGKGAVDITAAEATAIAASAQTVTRTGPLKRLMRLLCNIMASVPRYLGPKGPGEHDKVLWHRIANVVTCIPFLTAGHTVLRACQSAAGKRFGAAFMAVGVVASLYHGSWGRIRPAARKLDYWTIAASSMMLYAAVWGPMPRAVAACMAAAIPFKPAAVSYANFTMVEVKYLMLMLSNQALRAAWTRHLAIAVSATACFALDDQPILAWCPLTHATFHALSAAGFTTLADCIAALETTPS